MAKAAQVVLLENEYYLIKAPNGKVLEVKNFNTENGAAIRLWDYAGHPWQPVSYTHLRNRAGWFIFWAHRAILGGAKALCAPTLPYIYRKCMNTT